jgi:hypothetical protein
MASFPAIPGWLSDALECRLSEAGFKRTGKLAHRVTNRKVDVLGVELIRKALCLKWRLPYGSVMLEPACFLPFVPSLEATQFVCCRSANTKPSYLDGQIRFGVRRHIAQVEVDKAPNVWFVDPSGQENVEVSSDILSTLSGEVFSFYSMVDDLERFLCYLQSVEDRTGKGGIWNIGKIGSFRRLYLIGFIALELNDWTLASSSLDNCRKLIIAKSLNIQPIVVRCIELAISLAARHIPLEFSDTGSSHIS